MKNYHISEAGVSFEIPFGLFIKIWTVEHIFYIWQETIALSFGYKIYNLNQCQIVVVSVILLILVL